MTQVKARVEFKMKCESVRSGAKRGGWLPFSIGGGKAFTPHVDEAETITGDDRVL
jgi:hypothetical protein